MEFHLDRLCRSISLGFVVVLWLTFLAVSCLGQTINAEIRVVPQAPARVVIEGSGPSSTIWSFRDTYGGVLNLGSRIGELKLFDATGAEVQTRKIAPGHFEASKPASRFRYEVNLSPPARAADSALVSWLNEDRGLLLISDLLPLVETDRARGRQTISGATLRISLPDGWSVHSSETKPAAGEFAVADVSRAVFVLGRQLRPTRTTITKTSLNLIADGQWAFTDSEALELAGKVLEAHTEVFKGVPANQVTLILLPLSQTAAADRWSAETRGSTVTLLMGRLPSKTAALAQLSVPLTHELLHLWVPNGLALEGDYDWFYEGFTVYQAARASVRLGLLTFQEFLNAVARAYDAYSVGLERDRWSLIEASQRRFTAGGSAVYQKSMLVALLFDLKLRSQSRGKRSLDGVYREVFNRYRVVDPSATAADGNQAVLTAIDGTPGMEQFGNSYIKRPSAIDLRAELAPFGLQVERLGLRTRINVSETLTRQQRDLLRDLGYNDSVRSPRPKAGD
ncbi:MAG: hypothetical protein AABM67_16580 [Acidobacteriota bacterium]